MAGTRGRRDTSRSLPGGRGRDGEPRAAGPDRRRIQPTHGVVSTAYLDVRRGSGHGRELTSQLLLGEVVLVLGSRSGGAWLHVECVADGYRGWVREGGLVLVARPRAMSWVAKAGARVGVPTAEVRARPGNGVLVSPLFLNSRVIVTGRRGPWCRVELPDGRRGWLPGRALAGPDERPGLLERVTSLLGVPYHWGGRTPAGFDCSGFTQQVLAEQGIRLPRDAVRQMMACRRLRESEEPAPGDLVFFGAPGRPIGHVGIGLGGGYFAHCRGMVRIGSYERGNVLWDSGLWQMFRGWCRPAEPGTPDVPARPRRPESA
jgi:gamma-D-glutamyl-L-lysine dipeptidyl-peptidase